MLVDEALLAARGAKRRVRAFRRLLREGVAREVINRIQAMRKELDLAYDDRIRLSWDGGPGVVEALQVHHQLVADEVLAVQFQRSEGLQDDRTDSVRGEPLTIQVEIAS